MRIFDHIINFAVDKKWWVVFLCSVICGLGIYSYSRLTIDAYPDISGVQVQLITPYIGRAAEEVEQQVTIPLERAMNGMPRVEAIRSRTIFGLSNVQIVFDPMVSDDWARTQVFQKIAEADLPDDAKPDMASLSNNYGEIYRYELVAQDTKKYTPLELRTLHDWVVIPKLLRVPGVVEVGNFGGLGNPGQVSARNEGVRPARSCRS